MKHTWNHLVSWSDILLKPLERISEKQVNRKFTATNVGLPIQLMLSVQGICLKVWGCKNKAACITTIHKYIQVEIVERDILM